MTESSSVAGSYEERRSRFAAARDEEDARGLRLGWARIITFVLGLACYVTWDVASGALAVGFGVMSLVAALVFLVLVLIHRRVRARQRWYDTLARINQEALSRLGRDWEGLPPSSMAPAPALHPYALDLDICGEASLFRLLSTVTTPPGVATLRAWLLTHAPPAEIRRRQEAVRELAPQLHLRQLLEAEGRLMSSTTPDTIQSFLEWAEEEPWLKGRPWLVAWAWILPLSTLVLFALFFSGALPGPWWLLSMGGALTLGGLNQVKTHGLMSRASAGQERFARYAALLARLERMEVQASILRESRDAVLSSPVGAERELRSLGRRLGWADVRFSSLAHVPLQALFVWDVHVLGSLERWKARSGRHVRSWLDALGTLEALSALAALQADHPDWCLPEVLGVGEAQPGLKALEMGHPLLNQGSCVRNDVEVGPPGTFLFVTGSNMSGKSTLLRAAGANAVLAQAGGPVCAREMTLTPLEVQTSMRTADSLSQGISQYMAELNRIRQVVEAAREATRVPVLFLLDEPLQGTNEAERRVAVQTIMGHLLDAGAVGGVATHDLKLDDTVRLGGAARAVHLEGTVQEGGTGPILRFDYRLKPGRATSTNALALLRAVGLGEERASRCSPGVPGGGMRADGMDEPQG